MSIIINKKIAFPPGAEKHIKKSLLSREPYSGVLIGKGASTPFNLHATWELAPLIRGTEIPSRYQRTCFHTTRHLLNCRCYPFHGIPICLLTMVPGTFSTQPSTRNPRFVYFLSTGGIPYLERKPLMASNISCGIACTSSSLKTCLPGV